MSPILWDLGHIAHFEELWLTRNLDGPIEFVEMPGMYNPFEYPRSTRGSPAAARRWSGAGRSWTRSAAGSWPASGRPISTHANPLLRDGYVYRMVLQHEYQHNETILQTLQLKLGAPYSPPGRFDLPSAPAGGSRGGRDGAVPGRRRSRSAPTTGPRRTTTSGPATGWSSALLHRRGPGHQRRVPRLHGGRRLRPGRSTGPRPAAAGWRNRARRLRSTGSPARAAG